MAVIYQTTAGKTSFANIFSRGRSKVTAKKKAAAPSAATVKRARSLADFALKAVTQAKAKTVPMTKTPISGGSFAKPTIEQIGPKYKQALQDRNRAYYELNQYKTATAKQIMDLQKQVKDAETRAAAIPGGSAATKTSETFQEQLGEVGQKAAIGFGGFGVGALAALALGAILLLGKGGRGK